MGDCVLLGGPVLFWGGHAVHAQRFGMSNHMAGIDFGRYGKVGCCDWRLGLASAVYGNWPLFRAVALVLPW